MKVEFFRHNITNKDIIRVQNVLHSLFLTTGEEVGEFERKFSSYYGRKRYAVGMSSCTGALHLALELHGVGPGDEVITTPLTFVATSNAIIQSGATPIFVDVEPETGNMDAGRIEEKITKKTKAIIPVHLYGQMADMKKIAKIARTNNLVVIEDAAHALESERDGIRPGDISDSACFSFYATKSITSGEGGAVLTKNREDVEILKELRHHGITKHAQARYKSKVRQYDMHRFGWKYNMDNIQAALLIDQLSRVGTYWKKRSRIARRYRNAFEEVDISMPRYIPNSKHGEHLFSIWVDQKKRDTIMDKLVRDGVGVASHYTPIHLLSWYKKRYGYKKGDFPNAEEIGAKTISLPLYPKLKRKEVDYVIERVQARV